MVPSRLAEVDCWRVVTRNVMVVLPSMWRALVHSTILQGLRIVDHDVRERNVLLRENHCIPSRPSEGLDSCRPFLPLTFSASLAPFSRTRDCQTTKRPRSLPRWWTE